MPLPATPRTDPYLQELLHTVLTLDVTPYGVWRRNERPDNHAPREEWVASGRRWALTSSRWVAVDCAGTVSCTRGASPGAEIQIVSTDSPVSHGIGRDRKSTRLNSSHLG